MPERAHLLSDLLRETVTTTRDDGTFDLTATLATPVETLGIWLSMDGDDTRPNLALDVSSIVLAVPWIQASWLLPASLLEKRSGKRGRAWPESF